MVEVFKDSREIKAITYMAAGGAVLNKADAEKFSIMSLYIMVRTTQALNPEATKVQRGNLIQSLIKLMNRDNAEKKLGNVRYKIGNGLFMTFSGEHE